MLSEIISWISWLNEYSNLLTSISTVLLCWVTWLLYKISVKQPFISIYVETNPSWINFINIVIENIGDAPAYDVVIDINKDLECENGEKKLRRLCFLNRPRYISPQQKIISFLTSYVGLTDQKDFELKVSYYKSKGLFGFKGLRIQKRNIFYIDLSQFEGIRGIGEKPIYRIAKSIESIQKDLNKISTGWNKLRVITQTKKEYYEEEKDYINK